MQDKKTTTTLNKTERDASDTQNAEYAGCSATDREGDNYSASLLHPAHTDSEMILRILKKGLR